MIKTGRYLLEHKGAIIIISLLLIIQAFCDLSLPQCTSDIVDIGIEQGGIEYAAPVKISSASFGAVSKYMDQDADSMFRDSYDMDSDGVYALNSYGEKNIAALGDALGTPLAKAYVAAHSGSENFSSLSGTGSELIVKQTALQFIREEYTALSVDTDSIQMDYLRSTGLRMVLLSLLMVAAAGGSTFIASRTGSAIGCSLRQRVFTKVVSFSSSEIDRFSTASLITRSTNDIQQIQMVSIMMLRMLLYSPILAIGGIFKVLTTHTGLTYIIALAIAAIVFLILSLMLMTMPKFRIMQKLIDRMNLVSREILTGIPVIRAFNRQPDEQKRFDEANTDLMKTQLFTNRAMSFMQPILMLVMNCTTIAIVWQGAKGVDLGKLQVGDLIAFITYAMLIVLSFMVITMMSILLPRASVAADRINEILNTEATILDPENPRDSELRTTAGRIAFENVSFRYPGAGNDVVSGITFTAEPGQTTAIIGSTGSGKSTVLNLAMRFYDVTGGRITLDGTDIRDITQHRLHESIGYIPQKGILFSGTVESNLKFAGGDITDEQMHEAAVIAQADEFVNSMPDGYQSSISQDGTNVSGGQRQRLAIARAVAKHPAIFMFDDSFSALDFKTDAALRHALSEKTAGATVIIVAQRIGTIINADRIIVMNEGRITGIGTHEELMKSCSEYREIAHSQLSESELKGGVSHE